MFKQEADEVLAHGHEFPFGFLRPVVVGLRICLPVSISVDLGNVVLEDGNEDSLLVIAIGIYMVLPMVLELSNAISAGSLDVVNTLRHQFIDIAIHLHIAISGMNYALDKLLRERSFIVVGKLAAQSDVKVKLPVIIAGLEAHNLIGLFYLGPSLIGVAVVDLPHDDGLIHFLDFYLVGLAMFYHAVDYLVEGSSLIGRLAVKGDAIDSVDKVLELLLLEIFRGMGRILGITPETFPDDVAVEIVLVAV